MQPVRQWALQVAAGSVQGRQGHWLQRAVVHAQLLLLLQASCLLARLPNCACAHPRVLTPAPRARAPNHRQAVEAAFKNETVGLVTREQFVEKRATIEDRLKEEEKRRRHAAEEEALRVRSAVGWLAGWPAPLQGCGLRGWTAK